MNAEHFKAIRLSKRLTQKQFADLLGVSRSTVEAIENGRRPISDTVRARLAQEVDASDELFSFLHRYIKFDCINPI